MGRSTGAVLPAGIKFRRVHMERNNLHCLDFIYRNLVVGILPSTSLYQ